MKSCTWDDIKGLAKNIFNILTYEGDLEWAEDAWHIIEETPLCTYSNEQEYYRVVIRLFCLGEMYHIYDSLISYEPYERYDKYSEWVDASELQKIRFVVLAGESFYEDIYFDLNGFFDVINYLIEQEYQLVVNWLVCGFGNYINLLQSLEISSRRHREDDVPYNWTISNETGRIFEWGEAGFSRSYPV